MFLYWHLYGMCLSEKNFLSIHAKLLSFITCRILFSSSRTFLIFAIRIPSFVLFVRPGMFVQCNKFSLELLNRFFSLLYRHIWLILYDFLFPDFLLHFDKCILLFLIQFIVLYFSVFA